MTTEEIARWNACAYYRLVGMEIVDVSDGRAVLDLAARAEQHQAYGTVHGGVLAGLVDAAMGIAIAGVLDPGEGCATVEMKLNYTAPVIAGRVRATGEVLSLGRRLVTARAEARAEDGVLVSAGMGTFRRFRP